MYSGIHIYIILGLRERLPEAMSVVVFKVLDRMLIQLLMTAKEYSYGFSHIHTHEYNTATSLLMCTQMSLLSNEATTRPHSLIR